MELGSPVRHVEDSVIWFRVPLKAPYTAPTPQETRTQLLQTLLRSPRLFATPPTLTQLEGLAPSWTLPDGAWSPRVRWTAPCPSGAIALQVIAVWISRSLIIPELQGTSVPDCIELEGPAPELEEVGEIETSEGMLHLRDLDELRARANAEVNRLWKLARTATETAESAESAFFEKYGDPFSEDSDDSDES